MTGHRHERVDPLRSAFYSFGRSPDGRYLFAPSELPAKVRLIGRGEVGGKARGLIFVMKQIEDGFRLTDHMNLLRFPDSVVLATDVFDEFVEANGLRSVVSAGCQGEISLAELGRRIEDAPLPARWVAELDAFLEEEGRPLVVRSSSLMEDDPFHSFAGIYLSEFLANRGGRERRLEALSRTVKRIYASTFAANARAYRKRHGLDWRREKMAVLVQNMIGSLYSHALFYPLVGGVAFSRNYYPWTRRLAPEDGVVRLVVGTGTRAVGREYARVYSPRMPGLRPEGTDPRTVIRYSQETVDVLDMASETFTQTTLRQLDNPLLAKICSIVTEDGDLREPLSSAAMLGSNERFVASFTRLIEGDRIMPFTQIVRQVLARLEEIIGFAVDIEFAVDFSGREASAEGAPLVYLLQARPLGNRPQHRRVRVPKLPPRRVVLQSSQVLGNGQRKGIRHLVLVEPSSYRWDRAHEIARSVGAINEALVDAGEPYILMGPGRWASSNPQLGVPVQYGEISGAAVIVEMSTVEFAPELSYGTHFYADMVGSEVLYLTFNEGEGDSLDRELLGRQSVVYQDGFVTHFRVPSGLNVFVDAVRQRGVIALRARP